MRRLGVFLTRGLIVIVILAVVLGAAGAFYFKNYLPNTAAPKSFPQIDGEIQLEGLDGPVDIYRDQMGIPHIYATTPHDLFFAQGYVHAQDRFWQMDTWRHIGSGTLSEMFGKGQAETDTFLRTLGWRLTAEQEYADLDPETKSIIDSYTAGVNAYLDDHDTTALSLEYAILGLLSPDYKIEKWTPVNTLTWGKAMAWDLRGNMAEEIERAVLLKTFTPEQLAELYPAYPEDHPVIVTKLGTSAAKFRVRAGLLYSAIPTRSPASGRTMLTRGDGIGPTLGAGYTDGHAAKRSHLSIQMPRSGTRLTWSATCDNECPQCAGLPSVCRAL
jgi:penicillin amidase